MKYQKYLASIILGWALLMVSVPGSSQTTLKVLPLGNSITRGTMCTNGDIGGCVNIPDADAIGYRKKLYTLLTGAGFNVDMVGNYNFGYGDGTFDSHCAGFDGIRDHSLADIMETGYSDFTGQVTPGPFLNYYGTDMVLLHIGTNDILAGQYTDVSDVVRILDAIDDYESSHGKDVLVVLAKIISRRNKPCGYDSYVHEFNNRLNSMAQGRISSGDHLLVVDMECDANLDYYSDMVDQVHPKQVGYDKMGQEWFDAISNYNTAPVVSQIPDQARDRGSAFSQINLDSHVSDAEDPDQNMNWTFYPYSPEYFDITIDGNRKVTIAPKDPQWSGSETIEFVATDNGRVIEGLAKSDNTLVTFTVNWIPEITGQQSLSTPEETDLTISLDDITVVEPEKAPGEIELIVMSGSNYNYSGLTITPAVEFNGQLTVPVKIRSGGRDSEPFNLAVDVTPVNDLPVITGQASDLSTMQDECVEVPLSALEVTDPDDSYPGDFTLQVLSGANYTHTQGSVCPNASFYGILPVKVRVHDGENYSNTYTIQVEVLSVNPVIILPDNLDALQDALYAEQVDVSHYNPESFTFSAEELPSWLSFTPSTRVLTGIPGNDNVGENLVTISVTDGSNITDTTFYITVENVNDAPVITSTPGTEARTGVAYQYQMEATDIDPGTSLTYSAVGTKPAWLQVNSITGLVYGVPSKYEVGTYNVTLKVSDGELEDTQPFSIEVIDYNSPPEIISDPLDSVMVGETYTYGIQAVDLEGETLTYFEDEVPSWLTFYPDTRVLIGTPGQGDVGQHLVTLGVSDPHDTVYDSFLIQVTNGVSTAGPAYEVDCRVYPNPVTSELVIEPGSGTVSGEAIRLVLYDMDGRVVYGASGNGVRNRFNLLGRGLGDGLYLYRVCSETGGRVLLSGKVILKLEGR